MVTESERVRIFCTPYSLRSGSPVNETTAHPWLTVLARCGGVRSVAAPTKTRQGGRRGNTNPVAIRWISILGMLAAARLGSRQGRRDRRIRNDSSLTDARPSVKEIKGVFSGRYIFVS